MSDRFWLRVRSRFCWVMGDRFGERGDFVAAGAIALYLAV